MKILIIGDVVGNCGTEFLRQNLHSFAKDNNIDMIIANGSNPELLYKLMDGQSIGSRFIAKKGE